jgi:hypothetical protein|tara:strand:- start:489 stop:1001 length:513 start_codon:yes stop_codon:yes gene_type:complete
LENILTWLNDFIRENSLTSVILVSFVLSIIYDLLKKLFFVGIKYTVTKTNRWSLKNIEFLINHHKDELKSLKNISENKNGELLKITENTFKYIFFILIFAIALLFIDKLGSNLFFYSFLGASTSLIIKIIASLIYDYKLVQKSKKIEFYEKKIKKRIKVLKEIIKKSKTE